LTQPASGRTMTAKRDYVDLTQDEDEDESPRRPKKERRRVTKEESASAIDLTEEESTAETFTVVSFNINGKYIEGNKPKSMALPPALTEQADVVCVQETKTTTPAFFKKGDGFQFATWNVFVDAATRPNANRGVATFSNLRPTEPIAVPRHGRMVVTQYSQHHDVTVVSIYGCTTGRQYANNNKYFSAEQRRQYIEKQEKLKLDFEAQVVATVGQLLETNPRLVLLGDFNATERNGKTFFEKLANLRMVDAQLCLPPEKRDVKPTHVPFKARVDYVFVSDDLKDCVESCDVLRNIKGVSDHYPIRCTLDLSRLSSL